MAHRIRHALKNESFAEKLDGIVEADECFVGGVESYLRAIRPFINAYGKARLDKARHACQEYNIEGRDEKDAETGQEFTSHIEYKSELIGCLRQMKNNCAGNRDLTAIYE
jgi:hypothetical protein